ncbi:MAG: right-handed parallel beta-helix repeat-containing protein [Promethearchaeota archaeon]|nr:MAG: right-handed parallel beta-helix repeat-containing protein [Candidatus Lokiarchaeota archaeon]
MPSVFHAREFRRASAPSCATYSPPLFWGNTWLVNKPLEIESNSAVAEYFDLASDNSGVYRMENKEFTKNFVGIMLENIDIPLIFENCVFSSRTFPIHTDVLGTLVGISLWRCANIQIINCTFSNYQHFGLIFSECINVSVINSTFVSNGNINMEISGSENITVINCEFYQSRWGVFVDENQGIVIDACVFKNQEQYGIVVSYTDQVFLNQNSFEEIGLENIKLQNCTNVINI